METHDKVTVIRPAGGLGLFGLGEMWTYRELLGVFAWRDIKVRYKQTLLGAAWAVIQPLATMVVFTIFVVIDKIREETAEVQ